MIKALHIEKLIKISDNLIKNGNNGAQSGISAISAGAPVATNAFSP